MMDDNKNDNPKGMPHIEWLLNQMSNYNPDLEKDGEIIDMIEEIIDDVETMDMIRRSIKGRDSFL